jgi:hypothetical protein
MSTQALVWEREARISISDSLTLAPLTDANWDHGINRANDAELLLPADTFDRLFLKKGDRLQLCSSDQRTVNGISSADPFGIVSIDSAPVKSADIGIAPIRIIRQ